MWSSIQRWRKELAPGRKCSWFHSPMKDSRQKSFMVASKVMDNIKPTDSLGVSSLKVYIIIMFVGIMRTGILKLSIFILPEVGEEGEWEEMSRQEDKSKAHVSDVTRFKLYYYFYFFHLEVVAIYIKNWIEKSKLLKYFLYAYSSGIQRFRWKDLLRRPLRRTSGWGFRMG